jgi:hypothetical protein
MMLLLTFCNNSIGFNMAAFHIPLTTADTTPVQKTIPSSIIVDPTVTSLPKPTLANIRRDTVPSVKKDTTIVNTVDSFNFKIATGALDTPVVYHADDSMVLSVVDKTMKLYGKKSTVAYTDVNLEAPTIEYNQQTNLVTAHLTKDSLGKVIAYPSFKQAEFESQSDTIRFDMKTQRGITKGTYTKQGEMFVYGKTIKKESADVFYALDGRFTTCNLDTPHFAFVSQKIKFINRKMAFTGPVHPEFEGVPVPIVLPFGIYPLSQSNRKTGLLAPSFSANDQMGIALEGLGYYKVLSDNWDITTRATLYSYGGWTLNFSPRYMKRYRYQGSMSVDVQRFKTNFKGDPDFTSNQAFNVRWTHSADGKARPGVTFSANVNAGSSKFNEQVPNSPTRNFQNQLSSSITYAKVWKDKPYNLSVSANHNQNTVQRLINLNLPDIAFNVNTLYPFRKKEPVGESKWYENLGVALNTNARSVSSFYDTAGNIGSQIVDRLQWGARHSVPITLSLPQLGPFQIGPSISYQETWYDQQTFQKWNPSSRKIDTTINKGLYRAYDMSFAISTSTRIFGLYTLNKGRVQAIRHEIRPFVAASYKPDINGKDWYDLQIDTNGNKIQRSIYEGSIYGNYSAGAFGGVNFGIDNNLSMKVRDRKDTSAESMKKVNLLDGFSITGSYNFLRDSFKLDVLSVSARSNLFEKINITAGAIFDPYQTDATGRRIDALIWKKRTFTLGTLTSANVSLQTTFKGGDQKKGDANNANLQQQNNFNNIDPVTGMQLDEYQRELSYMSNNPGEFVDFSIPWDVNLNYSLRYNRIQYPGQPISKTISQDVNWNGSLNLSPKWKIGVNGFFNITEAELGTLSMFLSREMHCWQMAINISPVGKFKFFNISISPKASLLRDLKVNRTRSFIDL